MKLNRLKFNPSNPRKIGATEFEKLKKSITEFPEMMELRPMVYDPETMQVLGGNQRLAAIKALGMKEIPDSWAIAANKLTPKQKKEFVLKDNVALGEWEIEMLANDFEEFDLDEIGIELPDMTAPEEDEEAVEGEAYAPILRPSISVGEITQEDIGRARAGINVADRRKYVTHICPSCGHEFTTESMG